MLLVPHHNSLCCLNGSRHGERKLSGGLGEEVGWVGENLQECPWVFQRCFALDILNGSCEVGWRILHFQEEIAFLWFMTLFYGVIWSGGQSSGLETGKVAVRKNSGFLKLACYWNWLLYTLVMHVLNLSIRDVMIHSTAIACNTIHSIGFTIWFLNK